jgi:hypothetical protein
VSKSRSKRTPSRDWVALHAAVKEASKVSPEAQALWLEGKIPDPSPGWDDDYLHALQRSLEGRDHAPLLQMLDACVPMHPMLLAIVADVIRDAHQGLAIGTPTKLTAHQDSAIRFGFDRSIAHWAKSKKEARLWLSDLFKVSEDTIKRSLKRTELKVPEAK